MKIKPRGITISSLTTISEVNNIFITSSTLHFKKSPAMETEENLTITQTNSNNYTYFKLFGSEEKAFSVYTCIILSLESPLLCLAIYTVIFLTKSGQGAPVFVINLLISDVIQTVSIILIYLVDIDFAWTSLDVSFFASLYFMTCIAVERYLLIAHPIWYRHRHPVKCLVCTSLTGWLLSGILLLLSDFSFHLLYIIPLFYYLVIVFCFVGACRALSQSQSITSLKRRLVIATLLFVLLSYTFTILPLVITYFLFFNFMFSYLTVKIAMAFYMFNPIVDCLLYVFMRTDAGDAFRTPHCCSRRREIQSETQLTNLTSVRSHHVLLQ